MEEEYKFQLRVIRRSGGRDALDRRNVPLVESRYLKKPPQFLDFVPHLYIRFANK